MMYDFKYEKKTSSVATFTAREKDPENAVFGSQCWGARPARYSVKKKGKKCHKMNNFTFGNLMEEVSMTNE